MKSSDEMLDSLFERREKYMAQKKARMKAAFRVSAVLSCFIIAVVIGIGVKNSIILDPSSAVEPPSESTPFVTDTHNSAPPVTDGDTTTDDTTALPDSDTAETDYPYTEYVEPKYEFPEPKPEPYNGPAIGGGTPDPLRNKYYYYATDEDTAALYKAFTPERAAEISDAFSECFRLTEENKNLGYGLLWMYHGCTEYLNAFWNVIRMTNMTREEVELYNSYITDTEIYDDLGGKLTEKQIDALFYEDEFEARRALKSPYTLISQKDGEIYVLRQLAVFDAEEFAELEFFEEDVITMLDAIEKRISEGKLRRNGYEDQLCDYIRDISDISAKNTAK